MAFFEENRASDISRADVIKALYRFFPDIEEEDINFFYHGTYNVFEVKNRYIFRIPDKVLRNQKGVKLIQNELKMLEHIRKHVSVTVPDILYLSLDPDCPLMGYEKIEGIPLSQCFHKIPQPIKPQIAKEISIFLSELHSDELLNESIRNRAVDNSDFYKEYRRYWENYFDKIQSSLFNSMNLTQKKWIISLFNAFLNEKENFKFKYAIIHGDFDISNILVDPENFIITGIVDFEEARIYDPAADFLFFDEGDDFIEEILANYKGEINANFENRMKFLYGRSCLGYIEFGLEHNLPDLVNAGFQLLAIRMKRFPI
ncbi:MAG: aminoglycoside phosphotransferase family protein [Candidatus Lokiarchaeota archaeon]|nr:aminoglycoside phosphotransferase family protein [Candidatus Lokiarchaeota archaeon]